MALHQGIHFKFASGRPVLKPLPRLHHVRLESRRGPVNGASYLLFAVVDIGSSYCAQTSVWGCGEIS